MATWSTDKCTGGTAYASAADSGYEAAKAFDNNESTNWQKQPTPQWVGYGFAEGTTWIIRRIRVKSNNGIANWNKNCLFQGDDNSSFSSPDTLLDSIFAANNNWQTFDVENSTAYRYYRIYHEDSTGALGYNYAVTQEIEMLVDEDYSPGSFSPSASPSASPSSSPSQSPSQSISPSKSLSLSPSRSVSISPSASPSQSPSQSISPSASPSRSPSVSPTISPSPSPSPSGAVAFYVTDFTAYRVFQRDIGGTTKDITFYGYTTGYTPSSVDVKVLNFVGGGTAVDWTQLSSFTTSYNSGTGKVTWSGVIADVPQGGWYTFSARDHDDTDKNEAGANRWGVGILIGMIGQSNMQRYFYADSIGGGRNLTAEDTISVYGRYITGSDYAGIAPAYDTPRTWYHLEDIADAGITFCNKLTQVTGLPVAVIHGAMDGAGLTITAYPELMPNLYWNCTVQAATAPRYIWNNALAETGQDVEFVLFGQGETDGWMGVTKANYKAGLATFYTWVQSVTHSGVPFIISVLGRDENPSSGATDASWQDIIDAQYEFADETANVYIGAVSTDNLIDVGYVHWTDAGYQQNAKRMLQCVLYLLGHETYYRGPYMVSYRKVA